VDSVKNITFTRKTFLDVARENIQLIPALYELVHPHIRDLLSGTSAINVNETDEQRLDSYMNIMSMI
jgi:hypothetical protein